MDNYLRTLVPVTMDRLSTQNNSIFNTHFAQGGNIMFKH